MWDTCASHFGPKKFDHVGRGGQGRSKYGQECASHDKPKAKLLASEPSRAPQMDQEPLKWTQINQGQLEGQFCTILGVGESIHHRLVTNGSRAPAPNNVHS